MKKLLNLLCAFAILASSCCREELLVDETATALNGTTFTAGFEQDTRTYIQDGMLLRWNEGDRVSIFVGNTLNREYKFDGETGDNGGTFSVVDAPFGTGNELACHYAVYPYASGVKITEGGVVTATLPAEQSYAENSFGSGANTMVAATQDINDTFLQFKNVCGYLKLQFYGENVTVKSITLTGNDREKLAGKATIVPFYDQEPAITMSDDATSTITLNCGDGVKLGTSAETATAFWIVVPPTTFDEGFEITITDINGSTFTKSTSKEVIIERNVIKPMSVFEVEVEEIIPNNQIWYTCAKKVTFPNSLKDYFGAELISHTWDSTIGKGVMVFDGDVTTIGRSIFYADDITEIHIPQTVTTIGYQAFGYCSKLQRVYIYDLEKWCNIDIADPSGSPAYYGDVYLNGELLTEITIPDSITKIKNYTFCGWESVNNVCIHNNVTEIGSYGFAFCGFSNITLPMGMTSIGEKAFYCCSKLTSFHTPDGVTGIGDAAFWQCYKIKEFTGKYATDNGCCIVINGRLIDFADACGQVQYCIPDGVTSIGEAAFRGTTLKHITIPEGVEEIGEWGFSHSETLESITIPKSLKRLGPSSFYLCKNGTKVYISDLTAWCNIEFNDGYTPLGNKGKLYLNNELVTHLYIPDDVTKIGDYAFRECASITDVTISNNVQVIGEYAFWECSNLTDVHIGNGVTTIEGSAFAFCDKLTAINIPNSVTSIKDGAFYSCDGLISITIPESVTEIEEAAFCYCGSLKEVYCFATTPPVATYGYYSYWNAFDNTSSDLKIYVPKESVETYKSASGWRRYASSIVGYDF